MAFFPEEESGQSDRSSYHHSLSLVPFAPTAGFFEPHWSPLEKGSCYFPKSQLYAKAKQCTEFFSVNTKLSNKKMITSNQLTLNFEGSLFLGAQSYRAIATIRTYLPTFFFLIDGVPGKSKAFPRSDTLLAVLGLGPSCPNSILSITFDLIPESWWQLKAQTY